MENYDIFNSFMEINLNSFEIIFITFSFLDYILFILDIKSRILKKNHHKTSIQLLLKFITKKKIKKIVSLSW